MSFLGSGNRIYHDGNEENGEEERGWTEQEDGWQVRLETVECDVPITVFEGLGVSLSHVCASLLPMFMWLVPLTAGGTHLPTSHFLESTRYPDFGGRPALSEVAGIARRSHATLPVSIRPLNTIVPCLAQLRSLWLNSGPNTKRPANTLTAKSLNNCWSSTHDAAQPPYPDESDRRNRFLIPDQPTRTHLSLGKQAASQPPRSDSQGFLSSPSQQHTIPSSLGGSTSSPSWSPTSSRMHSFNTSSRTPTRSLPSSVPTRSPSFPSQQAIFPLLFVVPDLLPPLKTTSQRLFPTPMTTMTSYPLPWSLTVDPLPRISLAAGPSRLRRPLAPEAP